MFKASNFILGGLLLTCILSIPLFTNLAQAQEAEFCEAFSDNENSFQACPTHPQVQVTVAIDNQNTNIGDYLQLTDGSGASAVCSGVLGSGVQTPYTGDWYAKTKDGCQALCYDTRLFSTNHMGTISADILGISIMSNSGVTDKAAYFNPVGQYSVDAGNDGGWKQICVPIDLIDPSDPLPSNSFGQWEIAGSNAHSSDWNNIIQNVEQLFLRTDVNNAQGNSSPGEVIGYDNFCLGDCDGIDTTPPCPDCTVCCPPWSQGQMENMFSFEQEGSGYLAKFESSSAIDAQMDAWLAYAKIMRPEIESVFILFNIEECASNQPISSTSCAPTSFFDVDPSNSGNDYNAIEWAGTGNSSYKKISDPYTYPGTWSNEPKVLSRHFEHNRLYTITAYPFLRLNDGSYDFFDLECPIPVMKLNFQTQFSSARATRQTIRTKQLHKRFEKTNRAKLKSTNQGRRMLEKITKFKNASKAVTPKPIKTKWTPWYNTDRPGGNGDYQTIKGLQAKGKACAKPVDVQCRTVSGKTDWRQTGETVTCDVITGGYCVNNLQKDGRCQDYEVRYSCPIE